MIQTTAPTLSACLSPTGAGATSTAAPGADFAALLQVTQGPASATADSTLDTDEVVGGALASVALPEIVKGTQEGLAALALQAGAAAPVPTETGLAFAPPTRKITAPQADTAPPGPGNPALPAASVVQVGAGGTDASAAATIPATMLPVRLPPAPPGVAAPAFTPRPATVRTGPMPRGTVDILPVPTSGAGETATRVDGKDGNPSGKTLPSIEPPTRRESKSKTAADADPVVQAIEASAEPADPLPNTLPQAPSPQVAPASEKVVALPTFTVTLAGEVVPQPSIVHASVKSGQTPATPLAATVQPRAPIVPRPTAPADASVQAVRLEPIEIVPVPVQTIASSPDQAFPPETTMAPAPATAQPGPLPVVTPTTTPLAEAPLPIATVAPDHSDASPAQRTAPMHLATTAPDARVSLRSAVPDAPDAQPSAIPHATLRDPSAKLRTAAPEERPGQTAGPDEPERPASRPLDRHAGVQPLPAEATPVPNVAPASDGAATTAPSPTETPQDFDTLVSRLAEAREAASPHVVRTALTHGEFGRVSMQIGHEDGGLSVTMASRDPEFAGAVQVAAAAMAGSASTGSEQPRQDGSAQQQQQATQGQNPSQAQGQAQGQSGLQASTGGGQGQQARADASGQQSRREEGNSPQPQDRQPSGSPARGGRGEQRPGSGVYA